MKILLITGLLSLMYSCTSHDKKEASVVSTSHGEAIIAGKASGNVSFTPSANGVVMKVYVSGLKANGTHGYHIHELGLCDGPDFKSAGDHFNPGKHSHGGPAATIKHIGDLGNLVANDKGIAQKEILMKDLKDVNVIKDKAVIIHEKADDLVSQPSGNAGGRIACGIIRIKE